MEFLKSLESYVSPDNFNKFMALAKSVGVPAELNLTQNYPNPFNPVTSIEYVLPKNLKVKVEVYNLLGQLVSELVNEEQNVGYHRVQWDGSEMSSGIYFYRLTAGGTSRESREGFTAAKRMVLMR